ncbi:quinone oxidoreductase family protein [Amycolatopsis orientalis]|nr:zinc-binding dehydrogenase [Amycolatopsis orientalis]
MRAVLMREQGGPEVLKVEEVPVPERKPGEVLIRTEAIGVPYYEIQQRSGALPAGELPAVFGHEAAGTVVEADDAALVGRRVVAMSMTSGAYAELFVAPREDTFPIPDDLDAVDAVAAAVPASIALALVRTAKLAKGETVLIEAGGGAIGGYLARFAADQRIIVTTGARKAASVEHLNPDLVLDHDDPGWRAKLPDGIDVVFAAIGGPETTELLDKMTPGRGRILVYGLLSGALPSITAADLLPRGLTMTGFGGMGFIADVRAARTPALDRVASGLRTAIDRTYPLDEVAKAHQRVESREGSGKVVLLP